MNELRGKPVNGKKAFQLYYDSLLFLIAYPDNKSIHRLALQSLQQLIHYTRSQKNLQARLYNSGITNTSVCAAFSFEIVKWLRNTQRQNIRLSSFDADDGKIKYILAAVLPKVESEILQDANATWRSWLTRSLKREDMLDRLIAIFDEADLRPEIRDELWNAMGINVEINFPANTTLPDSLIIPYHHRSLLKKRPGKVQWNMKTTKIQLDDSEAEQVIACGRIILLRHLREIDPVTFTSVKFLSYYKLERGLSIGLMGMVPERRHPIDSYMGYVVFKNGLPIAYAGSWILFDSGRIGLNIFPAYRGGESQFIFEQILKVHQHVYHLDRFSVDPYQIGKENDEGIKSGAFWIYYRFGFRPIREKQETIADAESKKIRSEKKYKTPASVLNKLADSRLELILQKTPVRFDATDVSIAYSNILKNRYNNNRKTAEAQCFPKLLDILGLKNCHEENLTFILKNWSVFLMQDEDHLRRSSGLKRILKQAFQLKAEGDEEEYISLLQKTKELRTLMEKIVRQNCTLHKSTHGSEVRS